jgi:hypothetical protein
MAKEHMASGAIEPFYRRSRIGPQSPEGPQSSLHEKEHRVKLKTVYKNHRIAGESFQREKKGSWVSQYTLVREESAGNGNHFLSHHHQFNAIFRTEREANQYALQRAQQWIDRTERTMVADSSITDS